MFHIVRCAKAGKNSVAYWNGGVSRWNITSFETAIYEVIVDSNSVRTHYSSVPI